MNKNRNERKFSVGDLVAVKVQVQSDKDHGPAKLRVAARAPFRVLAKIGEGDYLVQKIPFHNNNAKPGKPYKESADRMELLPSTLTLQPQVDGTDTRFANYKHASVLHPLENTMGISEFAKFGKANTNKNYAYDKIQDLLPTYDLSDNDSDVESDSDTDHKPDPDPDNNTDDKPEQSKQRVTFRLPESDRTQAPTDPSETVVDWSNSRAKHPRRVRSPSPGEAIVIQHDDSPPTDSRPKRARHPSKNTSKKTNQRTKEDLPQPKRIKSNLKAPPSAFYPKVPEDPKILATAIQQSQGKMFIIAHQPTGESSPKWFIVEARPQDTEPEQIQQGTYRVRFYVRHFQDARTMQIRKCRYWPKIRQFNEANSELGKIIPLRLHKVPQELKRKDRTAYEDDVHLPSFGIVGPFDLQEVDGRKHCVPPTAWDLLIENAKQHGVSTDNLDQIILLRYTPVVIDAPYMD